MIPYYSVYELKTHRAVAEVLRVTAPEKIENFSECWKDVAATCGRQSTEPPRELRRMYGRGAWFDGTEGIVLQEQRPPSPNRRCDDIWIPVVVNLVPL